MYAFVYGEFRRAKSTEEKSLLLLVTTQAIRNYSSTAILITSEKERLFFLNMDFGKYKDAERDRHGR